MENQVCTVHVSIQDTGDGLHDTDCRPQKLFCFKNQGLHSLKGFYAFPFDHAFMLVDGKIGTKLHDMEVSEQDLQQDVGKAILILRWD